MKIKNKYYLIDTTWRKFCISPQEMIYSHFPEEIKWQLLDKPIEKIEFKEFPAVFWNSYGIEVKNIKSMNILDKNTENIEMEILNPMEQEISVEVRYGYITEEIYRGSRRNEKINLKFEYVGDYKIYVERNGCQVFQMDVEKLGNNVPNRNKRVVKYDINPNSIEILLADKDIFENKNTIVSISPDEYYINNGKECSINIQTNESVNTIMVIDSKKNRTMYSKNGKNCFFIKGRFPEGKLEIFGIRKNNLVGTLIT